MKKTMTYLLAGVLALTQLTSCGNKTKSEKESEKSDVTRLNVEIGSKYTRYGTGGVYYDYPIVKLGKEDEKKYPELAKALTDFTNEEKKNIEEQIKNFNGKEKIIGYNFVGIYENGKLRRADENVLSLCFELYEDDNKDYKRTYTGVAFDVKTGKRLEISDVVKDTKKLSELIQNQAAEFSGDINNVPWVLEYNGVTFMLDKDTVVTVAYDGNAEIFNEKYFGITGGYTVELINSQPFYYDTDGDGKLNKIVVSGENEDDSLEFEVVMQVDDEAYTEEMHSFVVNPLFVHTNEGKNYIYHMNEWENDDAMIYVYNINGNVIEYVNQIDLGYVSNYYDIDSESYDDDYFTETKITNPEGFSLDTGTDVLSTLTGSEPYKVGKNGMPESTGDGFFEFVVGHELTLKRDLEVEIINADTGNVMGKDTVKSGETVIYFRTDDKTRADLKLPDGRIGRVTLMNDEWPYMIDGVEIEDIFDGILWAG